jgi:hypothetical protein
MSDTEPTIVPATDPAGEEETPPDYVTDPVDPEADDDDDEADD